MVGCPAAISRQVPHEAIVCWFLATILLHLLCVEPGLRLCQPLLQAQVPSAWTEARVLLFRGFAIPWFEHRERMIRLGASLHEVFFPDNGRVRRAGRLQVQLEATTSNLPRSDPDVRTTFVFGSFGISWEQRFWVSHHSWVSRSTPKDLERGPAPFEVLPIRRRGSCTSTRQSTFDRTAGRCLPISPLRQ